MIRSDGKFVRDFLYIKDAVGAFVRLAEALSANPSLGGEAFNFALGVRLTVLELTSQVLEMMGRTDLKPIVLGQASSEIREQYLSSEKARSMLGWTPRYTLIEGLQETIDWYSDRLMKHAVSPLRAATVAIR